MLQVSPCFPCKSFCLFHSCNFGGGIVISDFIDEETERR